jgi:uracil phosphoribosyltransferase
MYKSAVYRIACGLMLSSFAMFAWSEIPEVKDPRFIDPYEQIPLNRDNEELLHELLPIVRCCFKPSKYERILLTKLRDKHTTTQEFRRTAHKIGELLIAKVVECLATSSIQIETPVTGCEGEMLTQTLELVSIMRSGDALLETFIDHFPQANISKVLVQRDEETAMPIFKYMKLSPSIAKGHPVIITEPMVATGGTLGMVIQLLKDQGVKEENIIIACVCAAPEGLLQLNKQFPNINLVMTVLDEKLNERKYIVPGIGDFGDRYFGTIR